MRDWCSYWNACLAGSKDSRDRADNLLHVKVGGLDVGDRRYAADDGRPRRNLILHCRIQNVASGLSAAAMREPEQEHLPVFR